jgi:hypothetical protein
VLRDIAFRKLRLAEVQHWLDHLSLRSPCYQEFTELTSLPPRRRSGVLRYLSRNGFAYREQANAAYNSAVFEANRKFRL